MDFVRDTLSDGRAFRERRRVSNTQAEARATGTDTQIGKKPALWPVASSVYGMTLTVVKFQPLTPSNALPDLFSSPDRLATFDHGHHVLQCRKVSQGVAVHHDKVGELTRLQGT